MLQIVHVRSEADAADVRILVHEFIAWLYERYPDEHAQFDGYFKAQNLEKQLSDLLTIFCPPKAECLLARLDGKAAGLVMMKPKTDDTCEMNRMYVRPIARGHGLGKALVAELLSTARNLGYRQMMLAAGAQHHEALPLYRSFGFIEDKALPDTGAGDIEIRMVRDLA